jgi:hypothetical protein
MNAGLAGGVPDTVYPPLSSHKLEEIPVRPGFNIITITAARDQDHIICDRLIQAGWVVLNCNITQVEIRDKLSIKEPERRNIPAISFMKIFEFEPPKGFDNDEVF